MKHNLLIFFCITAAALSSIIFWETDYLWLVLAGIALLFIGMTAYGSAQIRANYFVKSINKGRTKAVSLTFDDGPDPDPTYFYSSPKWPSSFRVVQQFEGGALGAAAVARGNALQVGSAIGDLVFPDDPLVSEQHCLIEEQAGTVLLTDLGSRTGVFVRVRGQQALRHGDELLVGRTRLSVEIPSTAA